nr:hypothetical protein [uncultured bacterium]
MTQLEKVDLPDFITVFGKGDSRVLLFNRPMIISEQYNSFDSLADVAKRLAEREISPQEPFTIDYKFFLLASKHGFKGYAQLDSLKPRDREQPDSEVNKRLNNVYTKWKNDLNDDITDQIDQQAGDPIGGVQMAVGLDIIDVFDKLSVRKPFDSFVEGPLVLDVDSFNEGQRPRLNGKLQTYVHLRDGQFISQIIEQNLQYAKDVKAEQESKKLQKPFDDATKTVEIAKNVTALIQSAV